MTLESRKIIAGFKIYRTCHNTTARFSYAYYYVIGSIIFIPDRTSKIFWKRNRKIPLPTQILSMGSYFKDITGLGSNNKILNNTRARTIKERVILLIPRPPTPAFFFAY